MDSTMTFAEHLLHARQTSDFSQLIQHVPYARLIGMKAIYQGEQLLFLLPSAEQNIGNSTLPAIHGGCIGGFMENAARLHVLVSTDAKRYPKVINFSLDYLRPGMYRDTYATCNVVRQGRNVVNVAVTAWQTKQEEPIATARTHLLLQSETS